MYNYKPLSFRIRKILDDKVKIEESQLTRSLLSKLTFNNAFYVECIALFVDIRDSSTLTDEHYRKTIARIYRAFISETLHVLKEYKPKYSDIVGDCVSGYFSYDTDNDVNNIFNCAARINSLTKLLNHELDVRGIVNIHIGIGISCGKILLIKAGTHGNHEYSDNEVIWIGDVVNEAAELSNGDDVIRISQDFYKLLNNTNQDLCEYNNIYKI